MGRAEEVRANNAILSLGLLPNQVNVNGGGVTGQDAVWPTYALQICNTNAPLCRTLTDSFRHDLNMLIALVAVCPTCDVTQGKGAIRPISDSMSL